eukprot:SAG11_NODE_138_length_15111_cov_11.388289_3_plen_77_part_00
MLHYVFLYVLLIITICCCLLCVAISAGVSPADHDRSGRRVEQLKKLKQRIKHPLQAGLPRRRTPTIASSELDRLQP